MFQTTVNNKVSFKGVGLHSGDDISVTISPAFPETGIMFRRSDVTGSEYTKASPHTVSSTQLATTINCGHEHIGTIEHLMAALYGLGIDNALVDVTGPEIPILDGSALPLVKLIDQAGVRQLNKKRKYLKFKKRIRLEKGDKWIELIPSRFFKVTFGISFDDNFVQEQKAFFNLSDNVFVDQIASARTFGFKKDVDALWNMGLARGGSLDNAVVIDNDEVMNPGGLRYENEFVRHKILDLVGDISLLGYRIYGHIRAFKSGHLLNNIFAKTLLESTNCYSIIELPDHPAAPNTILELKPQGIS
ncbi:UDP-3-O-acyl-N-acetylglucosamine deacetylase [Limisalsivibrio acetivorans]|uniref:UDP-3-O-acyl-N-acetylglucosamine deacetylase n=1 Tax=Limisalsivibrio acetivorans TaxID=1304888 RepID=UPI0003B349D7|nr:UDP-3-O-acyl-N-acetylglucosamine deacetylase [Limisalsivibrio acetivorans]